MKTTRLLVIDDDQNLTESMKEYFDKTSNIAVTLKANNGREGIELINNRMDVPPRIAMTILFSWIFFSYSSSIFFASSSWYNCNVFSFLSYTYQALFPVSALNP